jgi:sulfonate transport system substrate-binding protein
MKLQSKILVGVAVVLVILAAVWIAYRLSGQPEVAKVGIGTFSQAIDYGPVYVARHFGWFEEALREAGGGEPVYLELGGFDEIQTALAQGKLHAFFSAEAPVIKLVSDRQRIRLVEIGCTLQQDVLVRKDRQINSILGLRGKSIAVAEGTSSHYGLLNILSSVGLSVRDVTLRPGFPGEAKPLFEAGGVDAWAVWPPFVEEQVIAGRGVALTGGNAKIQSVMSLEQTVIDRNPRTKEALVSAIQRAKKWMRANPDEAITIVAQALRLDRAVVKLAWPKHNWGAELDEDVLSDIDAKAVFLKEVGVVTERATIPTRADLIDLKGLNK